MTTYSYLQLPIHHNPAKKNTTKHYQIYQANENQTKIMGKIVPWPSESFMGEQNIQ